MSWSFETGRLASQSIRKPLSYNYKIRNPIRQRPQPPRTYIVSNLKGFARNMVGRDDADDRMVSGDDDRIADLERSTWNRHVLGLARTSSAFEHPGQSIAARAHGSSWHTPTVLIWLIFSSANGVKLSSGREGQQRVLVRSDPRGD